MDEKLITEYDASTEDYIGFMPSEEGDSIETE